MEPCELCKAAFVFPLGVLVSTQGSSLNLDSFPVYLPQKLVVYLTFVFNGFMLFLLLAFDLLLSQLHCSFKCVCVCVCVCVHVICLFCIFIFIVLYPLRCRFIFMLLL